MTTTVASPGSADSDSGSDVARRLLRHLLATLAYRGGKALRGSPAGFADLRLGEGTRTPGEILAHVGDLLAWGAALARGEKGWHASTPLPWEQEEARFFAALATFDRQLAAATPLRASPEKLLQGPLADAFQHIGQIALLRRLSGAPVRAENYFRADIASGRVGPDQAPPGLEFD
jgi:hypothetical protein